MRSLTQIMLALGLVTLFLAVGPSAFAQESGSGDGKVVIGLNIPKSGPYASTVEMQERGYQLAIDKINANGGILGKEVEYVVKDTKFNAKTAARNTMELIKKHRADMISGGSSSSVAIAQSKVCQKSGVVFFTAQALSSMVTGFQKTKTGFKDQLAHRHTFRWYFNDWMIKEALITFLVENFDQDAKYFYISADYITGYSLEKSMSEGIGVQGGETIGSVKTPLGTEDYSEAVAKAQASDADVLVLNLFGWDLVYAMKDIQEAGLHESVQIVVPMLNLEPATSAVGSDGVDQEVLQEMYVATPWTHILEKRYEGSQEFVQAYEDEYGMPPGLNAACGWVAVHEWAAAVERAGTTEASEVIPELEGHSFNLLKGEETWRSWDHQAVSDVYILKGTPPEEMEDEYDIFRVVEEVPGSETVRSRQENPVMLEPLQ